jgi:hypothetical protein
VTPLASIVSVLAAGWATVDRLDGRFLALALAFQLGNLACRSIVWRNVLAAAYPERRVPLLTVGGAYAAGVALNAFAPARGGDVAKLVLLRLRLPGSTIPTIAASLSVVVLLDALVAAAIVAALWATGALPALPAGPGGATVLLALAAAAVVGAALALGLRARPDRIRRLVADVRRGLAVLRSPGRYVLTVLPFQLAAWTCRIAVVALVLAAFRVHAGVGTAALLVVLNGLSTAVPVPGGAGSQQALAAYALHGAAPVAGAVSFSLGMQVGLTLVNTAVGVAALMVLLGARSPLAAVRSGLELARGARAA